jgi:hypothetical protein
MVEQQGLLPKQQLPIFNKRDVSMFSAKLKNFALSFLLLLPFLLSLTDSAKAQLHLRNIKAPFDRLLGIRKKPVDPMNNANCPDEDANTSGESSSASHSSIRKEDFSFKSSHSEYINKEGPEDTQDQEGQEFHITNIRYQKHPISSNNLNLHQLCQHLGFAGASSLHKTRYVRVAPLHVISTWSPSESNFWVNLSKMHKVSEEAGQFHDANHRRIISSVHCKTKFLPRELAAIKQSLQRSKIFFADKRILKFAQTGVKKNKKITAAQKAKIDGEFPKLIADIPFLDTDTDHFQKSLSVIKVAMISGNVENLQSFLDERFRPGQEKTKKNFLNTADSEQLLPLQHAIKHGASEKVIQALITNGANYLVEGRGTDDQHPLQPQLNSLDYALSSGKWKSVRAILTTPGLKPEVKIQIAIAINRRYKEEDWLKKDRKNHDSGLIDLIQLHNAILGIHVQDAARAIFAKPENTLRPVNFEPNFKMVSPYQNYKL